MGCPRRHCYTSSRLCRKTSRLERIPSQSPSAKPDLKIGKRPGHTRVIFRTSQNRPLWDEHHPQRSPSLFPRNPRRVFFPTDRLPPDGCGGMAANFQNPQTVGSEPHALPLLLPPRRLLHRRRRGGNLSPTRTPSLDRQTRCSRR